MADAGVQEKAEAALIVRLRHQLARSEMSYTALFEDSAEQFYWKTGYLAPGKSAPLDMSSQSDELRREAWDAWQAEQKEAWRADIRACIALASSPSSCPQCPLCCIDDGLVQEWLSKVREVAKQKGLWPPVLPVDQESPRQRTD